MVSHLTAATMFTNSPICSQTCAISPSTLKSRCVRNPSIAFHPRLTSSPGELVNGLPTTIPRTVADPYHRQ